MRIAPVGLMVDDVEEAFGIGYEIAALTHGHPTGYLVSAVLSAIMNVIKIGRDLAKAINDLLRILKTCPPHEECLEAINQAMALDSNARPVPETIEKLGAGWIAEME